MRSTVGEVMEKNDWLRNVLGDLVMSVLCDLVKNDWVMFVLGDLETCVVELQYQQQEKTRIDRLLEGGRK